MFQVKIIDSIFKTEQGVINRFKPFRLISMLTVVIVKIDCKESSHLSWNHFSSTHQLHKGDTIKRRCRNSEVETVLSRHNFRFICDDRELTQLVLISLFFKLI
jgi:hypothetical protein